MIKLLAATIILVFFQLSTTVFAWDYVGRCGDKVNLSEKNREVLDSVAKRIITNDLSLSEGVSGLQKHYKTSVENTKQAADFYDFIAALEIVSESSQYFKSKSGCEATRYKLLVNELTGCPEVYGQRIRHKKQKPSQATQWAQNILSKICPLKKTK